MSRSVPGSRGGNSRGRPRSIERRPLADEVAGSILDLIREDAIDVGDVLPPITTLAERIGVSRTVVREAIGRLASQGILDRSSARHWVVRATPEHRSSRLAAESPIRYSSLADQAADAILRMILDEGLREGDALPSSGELAKRYGVSILVIREALASLAARGILSRRQGRESVVALPGYGILASIMRVRAHLESIEVDELIAARISLEGQAASLAATEGSSQARDRLIPHVEAMRDAEDENEFNDHDLAFHLELSRLSRNRAIHLMLEALHDVIRSVMDVTYQQVVRRHDQEGVERSIRNHEAIAEAVIAGDPEAAVEAIHQHFAITR